MSPGRNHDHRHDSAGGEWATDKARRVRDLSAVASTSAAPRSRRSRSIAAIACSARRGGPLPLPADPPTWPRSSRGRCPRPAPRPGSSRTRWRGGGRLARDPSIRRPERWRTRATFREWAGLVPARGNAELRARSLRARGQRRPSGNRRRVQARRRRALPLDTRRVLGEQASGEARPRIASRGSVAAARARSGTRSSVRR